MIRTALRPFGHTLRRAFITSTTSHTKPHQKSAAAEPNANAAEPPQPADNTQPNAAHSPPQPPPPPPPPPTNRQIAVRSAGTFEDTADKSRTTYLDLVRVFESQSVHRRNHVEFIYAALRNMESFGVERDLEVYKALMNVLPKGKYIPQNIIQSEFQHYPKQQQCIIDLLEQMEDNAVVPDHEMQDILVNTFGRRGHPVLKYWRMLYWMPKFKNASPWLLPDPLPNDGRLLARLAVERMCTVDLQTKVSEYETAKVPGAIDDTWIVSGMSEGQTELLRRHRPGVALRVEGPFSIWLRNRQVYYFVLRGDAQQTVDGEQDPKAAVKPDADDVSNLSFNPLTVRPTGAAGQQQQQQQQRSVHEQDDGTVYAICATGTSTKDSLLSWIRLLESDGNPILGTLPVLFKFRSAVASQLVVV